jgi:transcriptional regulator with XRE-family HTH domain
MREEKEMGRSVDPDCEATLKTIASNVKRIRGQKVMDQETLAQAAGLSRETVSSIESGKNFSVQSLIKIAKAFGIDPADLFLTDEDRAEVSYKTKLLMDKIKI